MATRTTTAEAKRLLPDVTGYDTDLRYFATKYRQGGRTVYSLNLSLDQVRSLVPRPNPAEPMPGNRAIRPGHSEDFAKYVRERADWIAPGMIFRAPSSAHFEFESVQEVAGASFGVLSFPRTTARDVFILDGQHRTLGVYIADEKIAHDLEQARNTLAAARRSAGAGSNEAKDAQRRVDALLDQRDRLSTERISIDVYIEDDPTAYRQMFVDIADNALGITQSVRARFDSTKVVNRALEEVLAHPLLKERVDMEGDYIRRGSPNLMGAKHVAELIRAAIVGIDGRVSRRQDAEWKEQTVAASANDTLDLLVDTFPPLQAVVLGQVNAQQLRDTSLLGSILFLRALAATVYELRSERHLWTRQLVAEFLAKLAPHTTGPEQVPVHRESIWVKYLPEGVFTEGAMAPASRRQDMRAFVDGLVGWAIERPSFLDEPPAPRPPLSEDELAELAIAAEEKDAAQAGERKSVAYLAAVKR